MPDITVTVRAPRGAPTPPGACPIAPGATESRPAGRARVAFHAVYGGGALPTGATAPSRVSFRLHLLNSVLSALEVRGGDWTGTTLHRETRDDKSTLSHRIGVTMAAVVADTVLNLRAFVQRDALVPPTRTERGDFFAVRRGTYSWHGVEAKGHGPRRADGDQEPIRGLYWDKSKRQAESLRDDLMAHGIPGWSEDHWAVRTRSATVRPVEVVLEDPPGESGGDDRPPSPPGSVESDGVERLLRSYYQVADDVDAMSERSPRDLPRGVDELLGGQGADYVGVRPPGTAYWLGVHRTVLEARRKRALTSALPRLMNIPETETDLGMSQMGLAFVALDGLVGDVG